MNATTAKTGLLSDAVQAIRLGQKRLAREILASIINADPGNEQAHVWSAAIAETPEEAVRFLECVLEINPSNSMAFNTLAAQGLQRIAKKPDASTAAPSNIPAPEPAVEESSCSLCNENRPPEAAVCPGCGAAYSIYEMSTLSTNGGVNERLIEECIQALIAQIEDNPSHDIYMSIGLGYLCLNRSGEALPYLTRAWELHSKDIRLRRFIEALASRKLILVVDDSATVRRLVSITLERQGHRVRTAINGLDGLAKFEEEMPDLVLLDITMPNMDGYEMCRLLRRNPSAKKLPIFMLSGNDGFFDKVRGRMAGATDYLTKPFHSEVLLKALSKTLQPDLPRNQFRQFALE